MDKKKKVRIISEGLLAFVCPAALILFKKRPYHALTSFVLWFFAVLPILYIAWPPTPYFIIFIPLVIHALLIKRKVY